MAPEKMKPGALSVAKDVDVDADGEIRTREGQTLISATASHSMWAKPGLCVVAQGTTLKRMSEAGALTTLSALTTNAPISYAEAGDVVYFSNGTDTGRIANGAVYEWGVRTPVGQPQAAAGGGGLPVGRYRYAMTFVRDDGLESGSREPGLIDLADIGGISLSSMEVSTDARVTHKALYISAVNGTELYRVALVTNATTSYSYTAAGADLGLPISGHHTSPAPAGTIVEVHAGVAYVATGNVAYASDLYQYERFRMSSRFLQLPGAITLFASVGGGIYAATDRAAWFFAGSDPDDMKVRQVLEVGAIPGTAAKFDSGEQSEDDSPDASRPALIWTSTDGIVVGDADGTVRNVTAGTYGIPSAARGAGLVRARRGYVTYLASLRGTSATVNQYS